MSNATWRKLNQFFAASGSGKIQSGANSGFGNFLADSAIDTLENCEVEQNMTIEYGEQRNCDKQDLTGQPVKRRRRQFRLTFTDPTPHQMFKYIAWKEGAVTSPTGTAANEVQTLTRSGTVSGGTFPLSLTDFEGRSGTTKQIPYNATAAQIQAEIINQAYSLGKIIQPGDCIVSGNWTSGIVLTFAKRLRNANLPLLAVSNSLITGGGSIVNTQTTAGGNKYHTAQRSADGTKPLTSFATGDKSGSIATRKYGDAVVSQVDFTASSDQTNVQMVVIVDCHFVPGEVTSFVVPSCVNSKPVLAQDVRLKFGGVYEHRDLVSDSVSLSDNVPVNAAHAYDDIDVTRPFVRGDQPTQEFTNEIFGDENHYLYQLAENCFVEDNETETIRHYGNPGNRFTIIAPETKIKPQSGGLDGFASEDKRSTIKTAQTPYGITGIPVTYEAYLDQTTSFLTT